MKISPATKQKQLHYPALLAAAALASTALASCQQQQIQPGVPSPKQANYATAGEIITTCDSK